MDEKTNDSTSAFILTTRFGCTVGGEGDDVIRGGALRRRGVERGGPSRMNEVHKEILMKRKMVRRTKKNVYLPCPRNIRKEPIEVSSRARRSTPKNDRLLILPLSISSNSFKSRTHITENLDQKRSIEPIFD